MPPALVGIAGMVVQQLCRTVRYRAAEATGSGRCSTMFRP